MFTFVKNLILGYNKTNVENKSLRVNVITDENMIKDVFNEDNDSVNGLDQSFDDYITGDEDVYKDNEEFVDNEWNDDWNAIEDQNGDKNHMHLNLCKDSINGVVTQVINSNEIVIDDKNKCRFDRCSYGDIEVGDIVHIESNDGKQMIVKPLRYKILTGKITDFLRTSNIFIFCRHAKLRKTAELEKFRVGDVIKALVIEVSDNKHNWRAIKYSVDKDPQIEDKDEIKDFTNDLLEDKKEILIYDKINFGEIKLGTKKSVLLWIKNKGDNNQTLESCDGEEGETQVEFKSFQSMYGKKSEKPFIIPAHKECYVELVCDAKYCGDHNELMTFNFDGFKIGRFASVTVLEFNNSNEKFNSGNRFECKQNRRRIFGNDTWIVPGERVWNPSKHIHDKLQRYPVPDRLWKALENNWEVETVFKDIKEPLNKDNYRNKFHALIYLEECENFFNIRQYDMSNAKLRHIGHYLALTVPGLADGRPSLIVSDKVICFDENNRCEENSIAYEGFIHEIRKDEILMRFNQKFHDEFSGGSFTVTFQMSRMLYRRCHHVIDLAPHMVDQVLFPNNVIIKKPYKQIPIEAIKWFNPSLNYQQKLAVVGSLRGECRPTPYIIFGPPGTGKTVTIVESILQVLDKIPESRIIACTAANASADLIAAKLLESGRITGRDLIRISAIHRIKGVPDEVKAVTKLAEEDDRKWLYYRVIVTTSSQSGIIFRSRISPSHFTHTFIDESAQCMEPESLIPISMSSISHGCVVLAGDHHQLGPVIMSQKAKSYRLNRSLIERLMTCCKPYQRDERFSKTGSYNPRFVTKLVVNYRSDSQIMAVPSKLFYENELKCVNATDVELINSMGLKNATNFTGVRGEERQDTDCPSWYNPQEIIQCCSYLEKLYEIGVNSKDIGIITPYRKQVIKIRDHMRNVDLEECKVATIEEFQGDERRVIIVSMVRTKEEHINHDMKFNLGFVHNKKRFNVAISRAMSLIICIGDPFLLSKDECWKTFIEFCLQNQSYSGCNFKEYANAHTFRRRRSMIMSKDN